jgi:predicted patatin/cPLA2 family phospholipase
MPVHDSDGRYWTDDHPVLGALRKRRERNYSPRSSTSDGWRIGLAVEGGGMRGVASAAMLCAIEDAGFATVFDAVYAASSGAMNVAYFLGGETWYPLSIYYDDLATRHFIDFRRLLRGRPILNLDYAFDTVIEELKPLDLQSVLDSPVEFHVAVTDVDALETVTVSEFVSPADLKETLRASTWLPIALPGTARWRGRRAIDGGALTAFPAPLARADGCTHILSLSTRPIKPPRTRHSLTQRIAYAHMERLRRGLGAGYLAAVRQGWSDRAAMQSQLRRPEPDPWLLDIAPLPWMPELNRHELDPGRLMHAARNSYAVTYCALAGIPPKHLQDLRLQIIPRLMAVHDGDPRAASLRR